MNFQGVLNFQVLHTAYDSQGKKEEMIDIDKLKLINFHFVQYFILNAINKIVSQVLIYSLYNILYLYFIYIIF